MIKIFNEEQLSEETLEEIKSDEEIWSFPLEEIDYLLQEHENEKFVLIDNRLYEFNY